MSSGENVSNVESLISFASNASVNVFDKPTSLSSWDNPIAETSFVIG